MDYTVTYIYIYITHKDALVVTNAMLRHLTSCRFIIIIINW